MRRLQQILLVTAVLGSVACNEEGTITVRKITFEGVRAVDESRLRGVLATRENSKVPLLGMELPWGRKNSFEQARFKTDLQRIPAFYADRGYPDARVVSADVKPNKDKDAVEVTLTIDEGQPIIVEAIELIGFDVLPPESMEDLREEAPLKQGNPRDRQFVLQTHEVAVNELRDHGYPYARVDTTEALGPDGKTARVRLTAQPGVLARIGSIEIIGNKTVDQPVIARELAFSPGDLYRRSVVQASQRRLYGLALFQFVNIEPTQKETQPTEIPMRVTVLEAKHQHVNFAVGYGTEEKGRVEGEYRHVNFLGGARTAAVHALYSALDRGVRLEYGQPHFFRRNLSFGASAQQWATFTPAYESNTTGGNATVTQSFGLQNTLSLSLIRERTKSIIAEEVRNDPSLIDDLIALGLDPTTNSQEGTLTAIGIEARRSTADNLFSPTRGYQLTLTLQKAGLGLGTFNYMALQTDARHYLPLSDRLVLANRVQMGNINPAGADEVNVPFSKKFFLGGATTLRGWSRYEVSPLSTSGFPLGGNSVLGFSTELRSAVKGNFGLVGFLDGGNVWSNSWDIDVTDLRYAIGPGLRYQTPIGPIRFDMGYQLNPIPGLLVNGVPQTRRFRFHFSIGQAF